MADNSVRMFFYYEVLMEITQGDVRELDILVLNSSHTVLLHITLGTNMYQCLHLDNMQVCVVDRSKAGILPVDSPGIIPHPPA